MARLRYVKSFRGTSKTEDGCLTCSRCGDKICKGTPYRWWANRIGRMSMKRVRCMKQECSPRRSEYQTTSPHIAILMDAEDDAAERIGKLTFEPGSEPDTFKEEVEEAAHDAAEPIREAGQGYTEAAENIESGFEHPTTQSEELQEKGETLESQADELETWEADEAPDQEEGESDEDYQSALSTWAEGICEDANNAVTEAAEAY